MFGKLHYSFIRRDIKQGNSLVTPTEAAVCHDQFTLWTVDRMLQLLSEVHGDRGVQRGEGPQREVSLNWPFLRWLCELAVS
jgi:hypothetical protein